MKIVRNKDQGTMLERYIASFRHAIDGFIYAIKYEHNMIIILIAAVLIIMLGLYFKIKIYEWLFCLTMIGLIMGVELINTSIEATIDLETEKMHPLAKIAKDTASSATLIFCVISFIGGLIIFIPYMEKLLNYR